MWVRRADNTTAPFIIRNFLHHSIDILVTIAYHLIMATASGSKLMKANGKTQVSIYLFDAEVRQLDRIAKRQKCKRATVVASIVRCGLVDMRKRKA